MGGCPYGLNATFHHESNGNNKNFEKLKLCGIKNYGTNCYLNSGLQIITRCEKFTNWLFTNDFPDKLKFCNILKDACNKILKESSYDPKDFIDYFCSHNIDFTKNAQNCSQSFIRAVLSDINKEIMNYAHVDKKMKEYKNNKIFEIVDNIDNYKPDGKEESSAYKIFKNKYFPKSYPYSIFSGIIKTESQGLCTNPQCNEKIKKFSFMNFIDQHIYLDSINKGASFKKILHENMGESIQVTSYCPKCHSKMIFEDKLKIIKCPDILIFTLERYFKPTNTEAIDADEVIDLKNYIDESIVISGETRYELFAINVRFGQSSRYGHQICQIKRDSTWYKIDDDRRAEISSLKEYNQNSYGLFYKKK